MKRRTKTRRNAEGEMSTKKSDDFDLFKQIPDELVILMFEKLCDVKDLCRCSTVSRRFSALAHQIRKVSWGIPDWNPPIIEEGLVLASLPQTLHRLINRQSGFFSTLFGRVKQILDDNLTISILKFFVSRDNCIEFLSIDVSLGDKEPVVMEEQEKSVRWKAEVKSRSSKTFVSLALGSDLFQKQMGNVSADNIEAVKLLWCYHFFDGGVMRYTLLGLIRYCFPMLKNAEVRDSKGNGRLVLREGHLSELKDIERNVLVDELSDILVEYFYIGVCVKIWVEPLLRLPTSGRELKNVMLLVIKTMDNDKDDDSLIVKGAFEEEEFEEAAMEVLKKKPYFNKALSLEELVVSSLVDAMA